MDPVTHTLVGASLSGAGLRKATPLATATLVLAANAPDVDLVAQAWGSYTALAVRRGITHGLPAMVVLPFLVAGAVLAWDRVVRRKRRPAAAPAHPGAVLALSAAGVWTHPFLDWLNNYGMRWLMPLDPRWSYGDALFIIDPWIWLLLGGAVFLLHSATVRSHVLWGLLAAAMTLAVVGTGIAPAWVKTAWILGVAAWIGARVVLRGGHRDARAPQIARWALAVGALYIAAMIVQNPLSRNLVRAEAAALGIERIEDVMVAPVPAQPLRGQVVVATSEAYHRGSFAWHRAPRLVLDAPPIERLPAGPILEAAREHPDVRSFLVWSRYPWYRIRRDGEGWAVDVRDARYPEGNHVGGLMGLTVWVGPDLEVR